jgi:hypothetical protein
VRPEALKLELSLVDLLVGLLDLLYALKDQGQALVATTAKILRRLMHDARQNA